MDPVIGLQAQKGPDFDILRLEGHMPLLEQAPMSRLVQHERMMHSISCTPHQVQIAARYSQLASLRPYGWPGLMITPATGKQSDDVYTPAGGHDCYHNPEVIPRACLPN